MENLKPHQKLDVWQQSMLLVKEIYAVSSTFPAQEMYGLTNQMRRAAVSIPANIAEGAARSGDKEYLHFLSIARGSLSELDTHIQIAVMIGYLNETSYLQGLLDAVGKLLSGMIRKLKADLERKLN
jgi:four helix bundle protein